MSVCLKEEKEKKRTKQRQEIKKKDEVRREGARTRKGSGRVSMESSIESRCTLIIILQLYGDATVTLIIVRPTVPLFNHYSSLRDQSA